MPAEPAISAKDDVSPTTSTDEKIKVVEDSDDDVDKKLMKEDSLMNASDMVNSMRSAIEERLRNIEPPMPLYARPKQRQHWGDIQEAPHKEWGDIFFDLFYVAG